MATWTPQWTVTTRGQGTLSRCATMQERTIWDSDAHAIQVAKECVFISGAWSMPRLAVMMAANPQLIVAPYVKSVQNPVADDSSGLNYPNAWYCHMKDGTKAIQTSPHNYVMESGYYTESHAAKTTTGSLSGSSITASYWAEFHIKDVVAKVASTNAQGAQGGTHPFRALWFDSEMLNSPQGTPGFFGATNPGWNPHLLSAYTTTDFVTMATWMGDVAQNQGVVTTINPERLFVAANGLQAGIAIAAHNDMVMWEGMFVNNGWNVAPTNQTSIQFFESRVQRVLDCQLSHGTIAEPEEVGNTSWTAAQQTQARRFSAGVNLLMNRGLLTFEYGDDQGTMPHLESAKDVALYGNTSTGGTVAPLDLGTPSSSPATVAAMRVAVGSSNGQASATGLYTRAYDGGRVLVNATGLDGTAGSSINYKAAATYTLVPYPGAGTASYTAGGTVTVPARSAVLLTATGGTGGVAPVNTISVDVLGSPRGGQTLVAEPGTYTGSPAPTLTYQWQSSASGTASWANIGGAASASFAIPLGTASGVTTLEAAAFAGTVANGWGTADTGGAWSIESGGTADYDQTAGKGRISHSAANTGKFISLNLGTADADWTISTDFPAAAAGGNLQASLCARFADTSNYLRMNAICFSSNGHVTVNPDKVVGGTATSLGSSKDLGAYTPGATVKLRLRLQGTNLKGMAWLGTASMPGTWDWDVTDSAITAAGKTAARSFRGASNTNTSPQTRWDDLSVTTLAGTATTSYAGQYLRVVETAVNTAGTATSDSNGTALGSVVTGNSSNPVWSVAPSYSGTLAEGATLTLNAGTWTGSPTPAATYQWQGSTTGAPLSWSDIASATAATYDLPTGASTATTYLRAVVTEANTSATVSMQTHKNGPVIATDTPPSSSIAPTISGDTIAGGTALLDLGTWTGSPPPALTDEWQSSGDGGATWTSYTPAQTGTAYLLVAGDDGNLIRATVTAANRAGTAIVAAAAVGPITLPPQFPNLTIQIAQE